MGGTERPFSHADAIVHNVLYDPACDMAYWFDFETHHCSGWPTALRQADDLRALADSAAASLPEHLLIPAARLMAASLRPDIQQALAHLLHVQRQRPNPFNLAQSGLSWRQWKIWRWRTYWRV